MNMGGYSSSARTKTQHDEMNDAPVNKRNGRERKDVDTIENNIDVFMVEEAPTVDGQSLADLPEDVHRLIVPFLGLQDRSNYAASCKRLYDVESRIGKSHSLRAWDVLTVDVEKGITLKGGKIVDDGGRDKWKSITLSVKVVAPSKLDRVVQRIIRTSRIVAGFNANLDLTDPDQVAVLEHISTTDARRITISHFNQSCPATISTSFIDSLPWRSKLGTTSAYSYFSLHNVCVHSNDMRRLYELARDSTFSIHIFSFPSSVAAIFAAQAMGIDNFTFAPTKVKDMTRTREETQVFYTAHSPVRFFMVDGSCETIMRKRVGRMVDVEISRTYIYCKQSDKTEIPYSAPEL